MNTLRTASVLGGKSRGFSLIELMVAMLLGIIVVGGLIQVMIANRRAFQIQQGNNFLQQNLRYASDRLDWSLRMADHYAGFKAKDILGMTDATGSSACDDSWITGGKSSASGGGGIYGYDGKSSFPLAKCVADANYLPGTDVVVVRYADMDACKITDASSLTTTGFAISTDGCSEASSHYLVAVTGQQAQLVAVPDGAASGSLETPSVLSSTQRYVYPYRVEVYYLQPCSDRHGGDCDTSSDGGNPQPTLVRLKLDPSTGKMVSEPLVSGIEQLQFEYGIASGLDQGTAAGNTVVAYKSASSLTQADWGNVVSVKVSMVVRNTERDTALPSAYNDAKTLTSGCGYSIAKGGAMTLTSDNHDCDNFSLNGLSRPDQFSRKLLQQVVQIRNRVRGALP